MNRCYYYSHPPFKKSGNIKENVKCKKKFGILELQNVVTKPSYAK